MVYIYTHIHVKLKFMASIIYKMLPLPAAKAVIMDLI